MNPPFSLFLLLNSLWLIHDFDFLDVFLGLNRGLLLGARRFFSLLFFVGGRGLDIFVFRFLDDFLLFLA